MVTNKSKFLNRYVESSSPTFLVVAVKLPSDTVELITNQKSAIPDKMQYYMAAYDDNLFLISNPKVQIVDYMIV